MYENGKIYMGLAGDKRVELTLNMCNRHGLIAGASGTGKTVTMKVMAESFSDAGVPVFLCDVKGDVAGICAPGQSSEGMEKRIDKFGLRDRFVYQGYPTTFWDVYQESGHAVRATVSDMGPELLSRILGLTAVQEGILHIVFQIADDKGLLLIDLKDLRAMLTYVNEHRTEYMMTYGNITSQSVAAILRALLPLEQQGGELFFGESALDIRDWMRTAADGRGMINVLDCVKLVQNPTLYASFLMWMLSELFEILPEAGDLDKPRMVFFFDEAHMLFRDAPTVLLQKVEQTVKLIRSRGVGVYFVTQSPSDIPDTVLAQLSNRVQHALRAYTPTELKAVRAAARAFRPNPAFQAEDAIMELGVGEALTSFLDEAGVPTMVERTKIICPQSLMSVPEPMVRAKVMMHDGMEKYDEFVDNVSAYEVLTAEREEAEAAKQEEADRKAHEKEEAQAEKLRLKEEEAETKAQTEAGGRGSPQGGAPGGQDRVPTDLSRRSGAQAGPAGCAEKVVTRLLTEYLSTTIKRRKQYEKENFGPIFSGCGCGFDCGDRHCKTLSPKSIGGIPGKAVGAPLHRGAGIHRRRGKD